jgi:hypothetical protein
VDVLGRFPLPVEVIPMARSYVARELVKLGGTPVWREGFVTDNGNLILDVQNLQITEPAKLEQQINNIAGVVTVGIFARPAPKGCGRDCILPPAHIRLDKIPASGTADKHSALRTGGTIPPPT